MFRETFVPAALAFTLLAAPAHAMDKTLKMATLDMEEGASTLFVTPEGRSLLIDTGSPHRVQQPWGLDGASTGADRIVAAAKSLGVRKIDYVIVTHYHGGHVGGVIDLLARMPVGTFVDHGPNREIPDLTLTPETPANHQARSTAENYRHYLEAIKGHRHMVVKPGDVLHIGSLIDTIVAAGGKVLAKPLPGAGKPGALCETPPLAADGGIENAESVSSILSFGKVRIAALGDLSWNREHDLVCPIDKVSHVNVLLVTQHGTELSTNPASIAALRPDIAVMANSGVYGAVPAVVNTISASRGLQGFWKMHASKAHGELDGDPNFIANLQSAPDPGDSIRLNIARDGRISARNTRNGFSKSYRVK